VPCCFVRWIPYGPQAVIIYFADEIGEDAFLRGRAVSAALERRPPPGLREFVTSFTSVLLEFYPGHPPDGETVAATLAAAVHARASHPPPPKLIDVLYDGPDLGRVAEHAGCSEQEVVEAHAEPTYRVHALGFAPGFPYLGGLPPRLHVPRLPTPRLHVPAGSVAIGGAQTGIYPAASPGGWNLIGRTTTRLFNPSLRGEKAFYLHAGDLVRFQPVRPRRP